MSRLWHLIAASLFLPHVPVAIEPARRHDVFNEVVFAQQSLGTSREEQMLLQMQRVFAEY